MPHGFTLIAAAAIGMLGLSHPAPKPDLLAANLDTTVRPGDDFFQYANGGWFKRNPIPATESAWGMVYLSQEQVDQALREINSRAAATLALRGLTNERSVISGRRRWTSLRPAGLESGPCGKSWRVSTV